MLDTDLNPRLVVPSLPAYLPIATALTEHTVKAFGFDDEVALALVLATEEIFSALSSERLPLTIEVRNGLYYAELAFSFPKASMPVQQLNLTSVVEVGDEHDFDQVGWLVAARSVDRLQLEQTGPRTFQLRLRKNRNYPEVEAPRPCHSSSNPVADIRTPAPQELALFAERVAALTEQNLLVDFFRKPGKLLDMVACGDLEAVLALSSTGDPLAGVILDRRHPKTALMHGPFLFHQPPDVGQRLFHEALQRLARSAVTGVLSEQVQTSLPSGEMEVLGRRAFRFPHGGTHHLTTFYRHLREDEGATVWVAPWLEEFVVAQYDRLDLPREVQRWVHTGSHQEPYSVLSCDVRTTRAEVILRPLLAGADASSNLREHLRMLAREPYPNLSFHLDLGRPNEMAFAEALQEHGFRPVLLEPSGGQGDLLILELEGTPR